MEPVALVFSILFALYAIAIGLLIYGFEKVKGFEVNFSVPKTAFSIIIAFRNEESHLPDLLKSLSRLNYPKDLFEIILVDDHSDDSSIDVISHWQKENPDFALAVLQNRRISNSPKKDAITTAISAAKYDWVITTDADCEVRENWLSVMDGYIGNNPVEMIAGPVNFPANGSFLSHFQQMDMLSLQGATIGSFGLNNAFMCNGANFAYTKQLFRKLSGFDGNAHISSGDDVFLLQKAMASFPQKVGYLKSRQAIVTTKTEGSWPALFRQRVRWASKATAYQSGFSKGLASIVFMANLSIVCAGLFTVLGWMDWRLLLVLFSVKFTFDSILMYKTNQLLGMCMYSVVLSSLAYPFFSTAVALYSLVGNFEWKGRKFKS
ncbi:glycosyltransferase family 2 protein [Flavobacterium humi]|uniref:Glycosyltransferase n=1 Tax=Flavobacterium humi TaxID=2562683 RepID=A0A4Z0L7V0_9FLAO|nr:glycosyltransferase [Flavobacterium humi]TGD57670.1 glycosyltransferase [Flavobacterium humi]